MKEIDAETMELLLNYIYTGRVSDFKAVSVVELFKVQSYITFFFFFFFFFSISILIMSGCGQIQTGPSQTHV